MSPAGLRGIDRQAGRLGDVIVSVNDQPVRRLSDLTGVLDEVGIGHKLDVWQGGAGPVAPFQFRNTVARLLRPGGT
jgi:hypothetical protein